MKQIMALTFCLLTAGAVFAQKVIMPAKSPAPVKKASPKPSRNALGGSVLDSHKRPMAGAQVFVYQPDSSISASGFTDATGHYETNSVVPGMYLVKIVYPSSRTIAVSGVPIKTGLTTMNVSMAEPAADTMLPYTYFVPQAEKKAVAGAKKK